MNTTAESPEPGHRGFSFWLLKILKYFGLTLLLLLALLVLASLFGIPIPLNFLKNTIESSVATSIKRQLVIDGDLAVIPGLSPRLSLENARLGNPQSWQENEFMEVEKIEAGIHLLPLLDSKIHIAEVLVDGLKVNLQQPEQGDANWVFHTDTAAAPEKESVEGKTGDSGMELLAIDEIKLRAIELAYQNDPEQQRMQFAIEEALIKAPEKQALGLDLDGVFQQQTFAMKLETASLQDLVNLQFPLPLKAVSNLGKLQLDVEGELQAFTQFSLKLHLFGQSLGQLNETLGLGLPDLQQYDVASTLIYENSKLKLSEFQASFDESQLSAELAIDHKQKPLQIDGELDIKFLDLQAFLATIDDSEDSGNISETEVEVDKTGNGKQKKVDLGQAAAYLSLLDADIKLNVNQIKGNGLSISDSYVHLLLQDGHLQTPLTLHLNGIPLEGELSLQKKDQGVELALNLDVENADFADLEQWFELENIDGSIGKLSIQALAAGKTPKALVNQLGTVLILENAQLSYDDRNSGENVDFLLEYLKADVAMRQALRVQAKGMLLEESFDIELQGGKLKQLLKGKQWPIDIKARAGDASITVNGHIAKVEASSGPVLNLKIAGDRFGGLARFLGTKANVEADYSLLGKLALNKQKWSISDLAVELGNTNLTGTLGGVKSKDKDLLSLQLQAGVIDLPEITQFFASETKAPGPAQDTENNTGGNLNLDLPILPKGIGLPNADIDIDIKQFKLDDFDIQNIMIDGELRDGKLKPSPFSMQLGAAVFSGDLAFDALADMPQADFNLLTENTDIGELLKQLKVSDDLDIAAKKISLEMHIRGETLGAILDHSEIRAEIRQGQWTLLDQGSGGKLPVIVETADLTILPQQNLELNLQVAIKGVPMTMKIETNHPASIQEGDQAEISISAQYDNTQLLLNGKTKIPFDLQTVDLDLDLRGDYLGALSPIVGMRLPAFGPYQLKGALHSAGNGYFLDQLNVKVGQSTLSGQAQLLTATAVPEFAVSLKSRNIQLNDFIVDEQSRKKIKQSITQAKVEESGEKTTASENTERPDEEAPRFTGETLALANGTFNLDVEQVYSGKDWLGKGSVVIELKAGQLRFDPVSLDAPGGAFNATLLVLPDGEAVKAHVTADIETFDYGILARRIDPETTMSGLVYLDVDLQSQTRYLDNLLKNANGHFDLAVVPEDFESGIIDLWAVGLLSAILPKLDSDVSLVNCLVARFDMEEGIMNDDLIILDTSKLRAEGKGSINFRDESIDLRLTPEAKKPQFFRVEAPIEIEGKFSDLGIGLTGGLVGTSIRMAVTTVTTPLKRIFGEKIPEDGSDLCTNPMQRENENGSGQSN